MASTFTCVQCGRCCNNLRKLAGPDVRSTLNKSQGRSGLYIIPSTGRIAPWLFEWEVEHLSIEAENIGVKFPVRPNVIYVDARLSQPLTMEWAMDFKECPFHREGHCSIYGRHPLVCRQYPFLNIKSISNGCPQAPPIPGNLNGAPLEHWLNVAYGDVYRHALHLNCVLHYTHGLLGSLIRRGLLHPAESRGLGHVNRLVKQAGAVGFFSYAIRNGLMTESEYFMRIEKLRTLAGSLELMKML